MKLTTIWHPRRIAGAQLASIVPPVLIFLENVAIYREASQLLLIGAVCTDVTFVPEVLGAIRQF